MRHQPLLRNLYRRYRLSLLGLAALLYILPCGAQTAADSLAIVHAQWQTREVAPGITGKTCSFANLYGGAQYVSLVEVSGRYTAGIGVSEEMKPLSQLAGSRQAVAAINGSFYDMGNGHSVCFLKEGGEVMGTTTEQEFAIRVTGAVRITRSGRVKLQPWSAAKERRFKKRHGAVLASGPLMLRKGRNADWSQCDEDFIRTKHPRSALAVTADKRLLLVTVDGRSEGHATGMSITELAHLLKMIGARDALNLDGGGSTMLYLGGAILNHPCDNRQFDHEGERSIPNFIFIR